MKKNKSILFIRPDYHCTFFYQSELKKIGWKADILVPYDYPDKLLYNTDTVIKGPFYPLKSGILARWVNRIYLIFWWVFNFWKYKYHLYYGRPPAILYFQNNFLFNSLFSPEFTLELFLSKLFKIKLIFLPSGCHEEESKQNYLQIDNGDLCNNCGMFDRCNDDINNLHFSRIKKYFDITIGPGSVRSLQLVKTSIKFKSIDLSLWHPDMFIPEKYLLPKSNKLRILHSSYLKNSGRLSNGLDSKGSNFIFKAIERLKFEGYPVDYYFIENISSNEMRFYQAQADIVVEQLRAGLWGSTGVETMALGKPVVCYLRPSWKSYFLESFPEYDSLPIIEATIDTIYEVLKRLITDSDFRLKKGIESRTFAEKHFDPTENTKNFIEILKYI